MVQYKSGENLLGPAPDTFRSTPSKEKGKTFGPAVQSCSTPVYVQAASRDLPPNKALNHADVTTEVAKTRGA